MLISIRLEHIIAILIIIIIIIGLSFTIFHNKLKNYYYTLSENINILTNDYSKLSEHVKKEIINMFDIIIENNKNNITTIDNYKIILETLLSQNLLVIEENNKKTNNTIYILHNNYEKIKDHCLNQPIFNQTIQNTIANLTKIINNNFAITHTKYFNISNEIKHIKHNIMKSICYQSTNHNNFF